MNKNLTTSPEPFLNPARNEFKLRHGSFPLPILEIFQENHQAVLQLEVINDIEQDALSIKCQTSDPIILQRPFKILVIEVVKCQEKHATVF